MVLTGDALADLKRKQALTDEEEFWVKWLTIQDTQINSSSAVEAHESVAFDGSTSAKERAVLVQMSDARIKYTTIKFNDLHHRGHFFKRVHRAYCERNGIPFVNKKTVKLRQFKDCRVLHTSPAEWTEEEYYYGVFPILPGGSSVGQRPYSHSPDAKPDDCRTRTFSTTYNCVLRVLTPSEVERFRADKAEQSGAPAAGPAPAHVPPADAMGPRTAGKIDGSNIWTAVTVALDSPEYDKMVDDALSHMMSGKFVGMLKKPTSEPNKQAYALLQLQNLRGYADSKCKTERRRMLRRFLACNLLHGRRLLGPNLSQRLRDGHERAQLNPDPATRTILTEISVQPPRPDVMKVSEAEFDERCVKRAFSLARQGELGRGNAALQRSQVRPAPFEQMRADLVALHPQGPEYPKTTLADGSVSIDTSGSCLHLPADVPSYIFTATDVPIDNLKRDAKNCADASPGPDGMSGHHVYACLMASEEFARDFQSLIVDLANCDIDDSSIDIINASILIGIPKASVGTRPLALGGTLLKLNAHAVKRIAEPQLKLMFNGKQFGSAPGGSEYMIHAIRRFIDTGERPNGTFAPATRVVIAIDAKNAFNRVLRRAMFRAAGRVGAFHGLLKLAYMRAARLIFLGHADEHIFSQEGVRQGEVGGCAIFCAVMQECLDAAAKARGVDTMSFIDDAYLLADSIEHAAAAFALFEAVLKDNDGEVNPSKSDVLFADPDAQLDRAAFPMFASFKQCKVIKCLGASVGITRALEKEHLESRYTGVFETVLRRMHISASPQLFSIIRTCFLPKLGHALRTHSAEVTRDLCQMFDALIADTIRQWASMSSLTPRQLAIVQLPRQHGGMGLVSTETIAPAAFKASVTASLQGQSFGVKPKPPIKQSTLMQALHQALHDAHTKNDPELLAILEHGRLKGADCGLAFTGTAVHPDVFSALLRMSLEGVSIAASSLHGTIPCPGCSKPFSAEDFVRHVTGCVRVKGGLVTLRHNAVVGFVRNMFANAGDNPGRSEPRHLRHVNCGCGKSFPHDVYEQHKRTGGCTSAVVHTSGPDILSFDHRLAQGHAVVSDVTIVSARADSHRNQTIEQMFDAKRLEKNIKYSAHLKDANISRFDILVATANGHLGSEFVTQIARCCATTLDDPIIKQSELSALIARYTAQCLLHAETLAGIRPPSLHLETLRLVKSFMIGPVDPNHDAETPKSDSLPRADDPNPPSLHVTAEHLAALIAQTLPLAIRAALRDFADIATKAALEEQQGEVDRCNEADAARRDAARADAAEEQHSDTLSADSAEAAFRDIVAAESLTEQRRALDNQHVRKIEADIRTDQAARAKSSERLRRGISASCASIVNAADAPTQVLAKKAQRASDAVSARKQVLSLLDQHTAQVERDAAELDEWCEQETGQVHEMMQRCQETTDALENRFANTLDEVDALDQQAAKSRDRLDSARDKLSKSRSRAQDIESSQFRDGLSQCARHAAGGNSDALQCASPTPSHHSQLDIDGCQFPANFLGQEGHRVVPGQFQQQPFLYEASGAVLPTHGYGNPSSSMARSSSRHGSSSVSQSQHRAQPSQHRPEFSPETNHNHQHFAGRTAAASTSLPASQSLHVAQGSATPAPGQLSRQSVATVQNGVADRNRDSSQAHARLSAFASTARTLSTSSAAPQRFTAPALSSAGAFSPPPRVTFADGSANQQPTSCANTTSSLKSNSSTGPVATLERSQTCLSSRGSSVSVSSSASRAPSPPPSSPAASGTRLQQPSSSAPKQQQQQQQRSLSSGQPEISSPKTHSSTDSRAHQQQQQQQQQQPAFASPGAYDSDSLANRPLTLWIPGHSVAPAPQRRTERPPSPENAARQQQRR